MGDTAMENVLAAIDASAYATSVCGYAGWAAKRLSLPVELLHVVQRQDAITARKDLSGAIGLGVKSDLMEELVRLSEEGSRTEIEKGRVMLKAGEQLLRESALRTSRRFIATAGWSRPFSSAKITPAWLSWASAASATNMPRTISAR